MKRVIAAVLALGALTAFAVPASADCSPGHTAQTDTKSDAKTGT